jgi:hypothetical protein
MKTLVPNCAPAPLAVTAKVLRNSRRGFATMLAGFACLALTAFAVAEPGKVLPPDATPLGYSLTDMAAEVANFSISGNDPAYYPDTPFQIVHRHPGNTFTVSPGTYLYVKFFFIDDAEPIFGDWPEDESGVEEYIFGREQIGAHDFEIEVDGKVTSLNDADYVGGPVPTPNSPDGSNHLLQVGAFVTPLNKGTHTITIRGVVDGDAFVEGAGGPFATETKYTIIVK